MVEQCKEFGAEMLRDNIVDTELDGDIKVLKGKRQNIEQKQ